MSLDLKLVIPLPTELPKGHGVDSVVGPYGCFIQCRGTTKERDLIRRAAYSLGISYGSFIRRVVTDSAKQVLEMQGLPAPKTYDEEFED